MINREQLEKQKQNIAVMEAQIILEDLAEDLTATPRELAKLAENKSPYVRARVASNPNTSPETLALLAKDDYFDSRWNVATNRNTPVDTLNILARDKDTAVRSRVAVHEKTPAETLALLLFDAEMSVRVITSNARALNRGQDTPTWQVSTSFCERTPVSEIFESRTTAETEQAVEILLCAAREGLYLSKDSFEEVFKAVTERGIYPLLAVGIAGEPLN